MANPKIFRQPVAHLTHQHLRRQALGLSHFYKGLSDELLSASRALENAERPLFDPYPVMDSRRFAEAIKQAGILHFLLDEIQKAKASR